MIYFDHYMKKLRSINGYLGSAVLNLSGETLYLDTENTSINISYSAALFNDALKTVSDLSLNIGFAEVSLIEVRTQDGHVFLVNTTPGIKGDNFFKLTIFSIFRDDGNVALGKMVMEKIIHKMSKALSEL